MQQTPSLFHITIRLFNIFNFHHFGDPLNLSFLNTQEVREFPKPISHLNFHLIQIILLKTKTLEKPNTCGERGSQRRRFAAGSRSPPPPTPTEGWRGWSTVDYGGSRTRYRRSHSRRRKSIPMPELCRKKWPLSSSQTCSLLYRNTTTLSDHPFLGIRTKWVVLISLKNQNLDLKKEAQCGILLWVERKAWFL